MLSVRVSHRSCGHWKSHPWNSDWVWLKLLIQRYAWRWRRQMWFMYAKHVRLIHKCLEHACAWLLCANLHHDRQNHGESQNFTFSASPRNNVHACREVQWKRLSAIKPCRMCSTRCKRSFRAFTLLVTEIWLVKDGLPGHVISWGSHKSEQNLKFRLKINQKFWETWANNVKPCRKHFRMTCECVPIVYVCLLYVIPVQHGWYHENSIFFTF